MTIARLSVEPLEDRTVPALIGALDPSFGTAGVTTATSRGDQATTDTASAVAVQRDGKIIVVGSNNFGLGDIAVMRLNPDGSLDTTFGGGDGKFDFTFGGTDTAVGVAVQADGRIVVVGTTDAGPATANNIGVARVLADGSALDNSFSGDGRLTLNLDDNEEAAGVAIRPTGQIVVAATGDIGASPDFVVAQIDPATGELDLTFGGGDGFADESLGGNDTARAMTLLPDGRIVVVGQTSVGGGTTPNTAVAVFRADGTGLDNTFNGNGRRIVDVGSEDTATAVAVRPTGEIVVAGSAFIVGGADFFVLQLEPTDGSFDTGFGDGGDGRLVFTFGGSDFAAGLAIQPDGKLVLAGRTGEGPNPDNLAVARVLANGSGLDTGFNDLASPTPSNGDGRLTIDLGGNELGAGVALDAANRILVVGSTGGDFAVARVTGSLGLPNPLAVSGNPNGQVPVFRADNLSSYNTTPVATLTPIPNVAVNSVLADVNGDGVVDLVSGANAGADRVVVLDGRDGSTLASFAAFGGYAGGVFVAAGDLNRDGKAEVLVSPVLGGLGPRVAVFAGASLTGGTSSPARLADFNGIADALTGAADNSAGTVALVGARVAVGDVNGDGVNDLAVAAGSNGGPRITIWDGRNVAAAGGATPAQPPLANAFVFEDTQRDGAFVTLGDVTGDGLADLIAGGGPNGGPRVRIGDMAAILAAKNFGKFDDQLGVVKSNFFAGDINSRGGIRVAARDVDGDGIADLVTGSGSGLPSQVQLFRGTRLATFTSGVQTGDQVEDPFGLTLPGGVFVG